MAVYRFEGVVPVIHPSAYVHPQASVIGDVRIGPDCFIGPGASLRGDFSAVVLAAGCNVQDNAVVHGTPGFDTVLDADAHIGHGAVVHGCRIGRNALIGLNAAVFDGATIGEDAVVAAMAFVPAGFTLPPRHLAAGVPARVLRQLSDAEIATKARGTLAYQRLAGRCHLSLHPCDALSEPEPGRRPVDITTFWPDEAS